MCLFYAICVTVLPDGRADEAVSLRRGLGQTPFDYSDRKRSENNPGPWLVQVGRPAILKVFQCPTARGTAWDLPLFVALACAEAPALGPSRMGRTNAEKEFRS